MENIKFGIVGFGRRETKEEDNTKENYEKENK